MKPFILALCIVAALAARPAHAQFHTYAIPSGQAVKLDGVLDDAVWRNADVYDAFFETQPEDRIAAKVRTEVRLARDKRYLYIAVKAFDPAPALIRAPFARRDKIGNDQDYIALYLDPSGDSKGAQMIYINPQGAVKDGRFSDVNGEDAAPDFAFEAAAARIDGGWSAELRLPFSSIAYAPGQASPWKLLVMRNMTRGQRYRMYSAPVTRSSNCTLCFSAPIEGLHDLPAELNWSATPQLVLNRARTRVGGGPPESEMQRTVSLDLKLRPDSATVIDATIRPDFSQVELDAPQLSGNTRFGLFVPEMRPFFLEGSDMFQTALRAIHTRAIGNPSWGARYTRREAGAEMTILTAHDAGGGTVLLPNAYSTNFASQESSRATIARATFKLGALAVGAIGTDRTLDQGRGYNRVIGPDFNWQRTDGDRWRGQLLLSSTTAQPDGAGRLAAGPRSSGRAAALEWSHESESWSAQVNAADVSDGFRADNGFFSQVGYRDLNVLFNDKRGKTGALNEFNPYLFKERKTDSDGALIYDVSAVGAYATGPYDGDGELYVKLREQSRIERGGALLSVRRIGARIGFTPGPVLARLQADIEGGGQADVAGARVGRGAVLNLFALLRPSGRFEFEPKYSRSWIDGDDGPLSGQRLYTEQAAQLNGIYHVSARDTLRVIVQASRSRRDPALYVTPVLAYSTDRALSLVASHIAGLGSAAYAGLTLSDGATPVADGRRRRNEVFLKLSLQL